MRPHRVELAGYLLAHQVTWQPITDPDTLRRLSEGNDSMQATRQRLLHSNLIPVVEETGNESYIRGAIGQKIGVAMQAKLAPEDRNNQETAVIAAIGELVGAGGCDSFASDVVHEHAPKLRDGESVERVAATDFHSWARLLAPGKPDIALDPWAQGPAILAEDRTLAAKHSQGHVHDPAKAAHDLALARDQVLTPAFHTYTADRLKYAQGLGLVPPQDSLHQPRHFIDPALPARAELALAQHPTQEQQRMAMRVAQEQLGVSPEAAALAAPDIVSAAKNLHRR